MLDQSIMTADVGESGHWASRMSAPLVVESSISTSTSQPIAIGIPFARGLLPWGRPVFLVDPSGRPISLQTIPTARWPDGSVKWILLEFILGPLSPGPATYAVRWGAGKEEVGNLAEDSSFRIVEENGSVLIRTGTVTFVLDSGVLRPWSRVEIDGLSVLEPGGSAILLTDRRGRRHRPQIERTQLESSGSVRATLRFDGRLGHRREGLRFRARLSFFAGLPVVRLDLTLHNQRRARHAGGLWDLGDSGSILFRDLSLQLGLAGPGARPIYWSEESDGLLKSSGSGRFAIQQGSSGGESWQSRNHLNRRAEVTPTIRGYRVDVDGAQSIGLRASPIVTVRGCDSGVTVAVPRFWEEFPKAIEAEGESLHVRLFPGRIGDLFELQGGEQKTHTIWVHFGSSEPSGIQPLEWVHRPARARGTPDWYADSGAIPYLPSASLPHDDRRQSYFTAVVEGPNSFFAKREAIDEYGWRNFGEIYADHEAASYDGTPPIISHYNNQYDVVHGLLVHYLRTGDDRWFDLGDGLARHVVDIDTYKTTRDRASYNGGLFWHTDHYRDAATATHRCYSRANLSPGVGPYGGGPSNEHNYATGLLHYYYLTGDPLGSEAVVGLADWVIGMDDGSRTILGVIDDGPTGFASSTYSPDYHGPGRGAGNSINVLLDAWLLTDSRSYLDKVEELIRRVIHPEDDIASLELIDAERRWSYTVFLSALDRYLGLKAEAGQLDDSYAYAQAALVHYARWMVQYEVPYLDHLDKLEYPTETWAAQDLRKANVLRLASAHVDELARAAMLQKADALADRSWSDLDRFPTRYVTRSLALVMLEGLRDAGLRARPPETAPRSPFPGRFGRPSVFVSQKRRVFASLKSPRGVVRLLTALANPRRLLAARRQGGRGEAAVQG
ncbi:hypothetical protein P12x_005960 (plasmid) [Tundrisphaera lichenicola]|uniref:RIFT barrel domain-containing protein n=1 Tax=Tundrisphaera lichenicola TaxID=2029860 RepID=UPI003EBE7083